MRTWLVAGFVAGLLAVSATLMFVPSAPAAKPAAKGGDEPRGAQLPVSRVVLFSSGVGHFLREGKINGDARVDLSFPVQDINDLIKSMVVRDLDGGHISAVSYDSLAPIERTLKSFAVNLTTNPSFEQILNRRAARRLKSSWPAQRQGRRG